MTIKKYLIVFIFIFFAKFIFSQTFHIGAITGYGRAYIDTDPYFKYLFNNESDNKFVLSLYADYKPAKPMLDFNSGLTFQTLFSNRWSISFLKLPLGMDFLIGKKKQLFLGFGIYEQFPLFGTGNFSHADFSTCQFGLYWDLGFRYIVNDKYSLLLKFQNDRDLTLLYKSPYGSKFGFSYYENEYLNSISLNIGFLYRLKSKE